MPSTFPRAAWACLALPALLSAPGCGGGANMLGGNDLPPTAPVLTVPAGGTTGFLVQASAKGNTSGLAFQWTIAPGTFRGGSATASGASVTFTPTAPGPVTLTCTAIKGNSIPSPVSRATLTVGDPSTAQGSFAPAGALSMARPGLAAAMTGPDTILVTGGRDTTTSGPAVKSTELYAISTGTYSLGQDMNTARAGHAVAMVDSARFLVLGGGTTPASLTSSELFSTATGTFALTGSMTSERNGPTVTPISAPPGLLVAGGLNGAGTPVNTEETFSLASLTFSRTGAQALARGHSATQLPNGKVLLLSHTSTGAPLATLYTPATGAFSPTANQPALGREGHQALLLPPRPPATALVYILGGDAGSGPTATVETYDYVANRFSTLQATMASPRRDFGAAVTSGGRVLLVGGTPDGTTASANAELFDPAALTFTPTGSMAAARRGPAVFPLPGGRVLVLGGTSGNQGVASVEVFTPAP